MSYEPMLIIVKKDLHGMADAINSFSDKKIPKKLTEKFIRTRRAYEELKGALQQPGVKISGIELVFITPQLTSHNKAVRKVLSDMEIEFAEFF